MVFVMKQVASLRYGVIFKKAFSQPAIFTAFVQDFLGITLDIDRVETEKSFDPIIGKVDSRFDLFAQDKKNRLIVDIQHKRYNDHYDRFLHYHNVALLEQISSSFDYKPNMNVYTIVVLTSGDKHKNDISITDFRPQKLDGTRILETQHKIVYLCPKYVNEQTPEPYREWLLAINDSLDKEVEESDYHNEVIQEMFSLIEEDQISPKEYARMKDEYSEEKYIQRKTKQATMEGKIKGKMEAKQAIALSMLNKAIDFNLITEITGISIEKLQQLKKENEQCQ